MASWSTTAPSLPSGSSWSSWVDSDASVHVNNYYNYRVSSRIARGANNTIYVMVHLQVYGWSYGARYPYVTVPLKAQVSVGNTSSYSSSGTYECAGDYGEWTDCKTLYYTGTAAAGAKVYVRGAWSSHYTGVTTYTAPGYVTTYTITYRGNGDEGGSSATQRKTYGVAATLYGCGWQKTGYAFSHWNTAADGSGTSYAAGGSYTGNAALTLYAIWVPNTYAVTYDANGGSGSTEEQSKIYGEALTLRENAFTREGHTFSHWNTAADGSGTSYAEGGSYTGNAALALYAIWTPDTYAVTYDGSGADSGATAPQVKTWGRTLVLSECGFVRKGYAFTGWNTAPDGTGTAYAPGAGYTLNAALTLYAQWLRLNIPVFVNDSGIVHQADKAYINAGGVIKECEVFINVGGTVYALV